MSFNNFSDNSIDINVGSSASDNGEYPDFCGRAARDKSLFLKFRSHPIYKQVLEHFTKDFGLECLDFLESTSPFLLENLNTYKNNDLVCGADTYKFGKYGILSPSTLRYIANLAQITQVFPDLTDMNIVEIGCGYGGLCKIIQDSFGVKSYTIIDLPQVLELTEVYLASFGDKYTNKTNLLDFDKLDKTIPIKVFDLCISNCAFTECIPSIQDIYLKKIIKNSNKGFIIYNLRLESYHPAVLLEKIKYLHNTKNIGVIQEKPLTCKTNFILVWGYNNGIVTDMLPFLGQRILYRISPSLLKITKQVKRILKANLKKN